MSGHGYWDLIRIHILRRKAAGRQKIAALSFAQKIEMLEEMRRRVEPIRQARESRRNHASIIPLANDQPGANT